MKWRSIEEGDYFLFARSFHAAARKLAAATDTKPGLMSEFDFSPVLSMYRHAIELQLKAMVLGDAGKFLREQPDGLSIHKTRSLSWLAQFVTQIVTALHWEAEFTCEGIEDLAAFKSLIEEANGIDAAFDVFRCPGGSHQDALDFVHLLDVLLDLLQSTESSLLAEWDLRAEAAGGTEWDAGPDFGPTIH